MIRQALKPNQGRDQAQPEDSVDPAERTLNDDVEMKNDSEFEFGGPTDSLTERFTSKEFKHGTQ